jgi:hypothetical protein
VALLAPIRFLFLLLAGADLAGAQSRPVEEYRVKAAFLYNFAKFVEWPADSFKTASDPITICVLGDPFGGRLEETVNGKLVDDRPLIVHEIADVAEAPGCNILFVASEKKRATELLGRVKASPILTVGDCANFAAAGGVIGFRLDGGKVRLEINVGAADRARIRISSKLLGLAEIVKEEKK